MRRALALSAALLLLLSAAGCSALFDRELYTEEVYEAPQEIPEDETADSISSYAALRRAIVRLVADHAESAELQFQNYDGTISQDISTACWEVKSSTALGAYAVDYISYDLSRIVSYYQAEIHITYKRSEYQLSALERVENLSAMRARLTEAMRNGETYLVIELNAASLTGEDVRQTMERAYYADPLLCPVLPQIDAALYPETGVNRIVEVTLDYGLDGETLALRRDELGAAVDVLAAACRERAAEAEEEGPAVLARALFDGLREVCLPDESAGRTAWDALTAGAAGSEGIAMALEAGCAALDIPCVTVSGRLDNKPHFWNIVTLEDGAYHVDASVRGGEENAVFLLGDEALWGAYWWDTSEYPQCPADYGAGEGPSAEPASGEGAPIPGEGTEN